MNRSKFKFKLKMLLLLFIAFANVHTVTAQTREVIYSYSFVTVGISSDWVNSANRWVKEPAQPVVCDLETLYPGETAYLTTTADFRNFFCSEIQLLVQSPDDLRQAKNLNVMLDGVYYKMSSVAKLYEENTYRITFPDKRPMQKTKIGFSVTRSGSATGTYRISSVKLTGIKKYNIPSATSNACPFVAFNDFYLDVDNEYCQFDHLADFIVEQGEVCIVNDGYAYIQDGTSGIVIDLKHSYAKNGLALPSEGFFKGRLIGIKTRAEQGFPIITGVTAMIDEVDERVKPYGLRPQPINLDNYINGSRDGQFVYVVNTYDTWDLIDPMNFYGTHPDVLNSSVALINGYEQGITDNYCVCGIAFSRWPSAKIAYLYTPFHYQFVLFSDDQVNNEAITGQVFNCMVKRDFVANKWHTLVLPFNFKNELGEIAVFEGSENGVLHFKTVDGVKAGHPFLFKPYNNMTEIFNATPEKINNPSMEDIEEGSVGVFSDHLYTEYGGDYNFVPTFNTVKPASGSFYLAENNTIKPLAEGGKIKGLRAFFEPATPNAARAMSINVDGITTAIADISCDADSDISDESIYSANGTYVGKDLNNLPKGVYVRNGKKVIK